MIEVCFIECIFGLKDGFKSIKEYINKLELLNSKLIKNLSLYIFIIDKFLFIFLKLGIK